MLQLRNITKRFGSVLANDHINITVDPATIHAIVGENGAGKSTAMRIAYGFYTADSGAILIDGQPRDIQRPLDAIALGVGMVHQHFMLVDTMTVAENIVLGAETDTGSVGSAGSKEQDPAYLREDPAYVHNDGATRSVRRAGPVSASARSASARPRYGLGEGGLRTGRGTGGLWTRLALDDAIDHIRKLSEDFKLSVDPNALIDDLSVGQQQRVELLKALYRNARLLILDEPTAVLTPQEVEEFFATLRQMREQGKTIVIITHKLGEVLSISDDVTVMRDGKVVGRVQTRDTNAAELARLMVGRDVLLRVDKTPAEPGTVVLSVRNLSVGRAVKNVTFDIRAGEIVGIAGVEGNGQRELVEAIAGLTDPALVSGELGLDGRTLAGLDARTRRERGIAHIPEDRHRRGLLLEFALDENAILGVHYRPPVAPGAFIDDREMQRRTADIIQRFDVRPPNASLPARALSGGNQQKLVIGREFELPPKLLLVAQPTRGVDIGAIEFIHRKLVALRDAGCAVLLVSAELEEVMSLSDRLLVIHDGRIAGEVDPATTSATDIGCLMTGAQPR
jgi:simple sugar transport system ATP-binding protein